MYRFVDNERVYVVGDIGKYNGFVDRSQKMKAMFGGSLLGLMVASGLTMINENPRIENPQNYVDSISPRVLEYRAAKSTSDLLQGLYNQIQHQGETYNIYYGGEELSSLLNENFGGNVNSENIRELDRHAVKIEEEIQEMEQNPEVRDHLAQVEEIREKAQKRKKVSFFGLIFSPIAFLGYEIIDRIKLRGASKHFLGI